MRGLADVIRLIAGSRSRSRAAARKLPPAPPPTPTSHAASRETLPAAFEQAATSHAGRVAIVGSAWQPTFAELNAAANSLAHRLRRAGVPGDRVAVLMQHDAPAVAAILATFKAGLVAVPLNPTYPGARLRQTIDDPEPTAIVTDAAHRQVAAEIVPPTCTVVSFDHAASDGPTHNPDAPIDASTTALLLYTSGTTGTPKGVMLSHRWLVRNARAHTEAMGYSAADRIPPFGFLSGGQAATVTCCALLNGATLCPYSLVLNGTASLGAWLTDRGITVYVSSASIFRHLVSGLADGVRFPLVRAVRLSSESATSGDFDLFERHFSDQCAFVHTLSSSETGLIAVYRHRRGERLQDGRIPIGTIAPDVELAFRGDDGQSVACGEVGEIVVRSRHLADGYWRQPALTAERFSGPIGGVREYRTGDLGRINSRGQLEYAGRGDSRVKIRGNRVELGDVESALQRLSGVERALVESVEKTDHERALLAYVVVDARHAWSTATLRPALRELVPDHMVPSAFVLLDRFPLTSSGKIDRELLRARRPALRPPVSRAPSSTGAESEPGARLQRTLRTVWQDVLGRQDIGPDDDFFALGGDSLSGVDVLLKIEQQLELQLPLPVLIQAPTINQLAALLERAALSPTDNVVRIHPTGTRPPLFAFCGRYGHVLRLIPVLRSLGPGQPCVGLQPPGLDWRSVGCTTVEEMAAFYLGQIRSIQPHGPYRLVGTSFGGLLAFEIAVQLQRQGERTDFLGLVDTSPPTILGEDGFDTGRSRFLDLGPPPERPDSIEAVNRCLAESHVAARRRYVLDARREGQRIDGVLTYFHCTGNPVLAENERRHLWQRFAGTELRLLPLPGIHGSFHQEPQTSALGSLLRACLDRDPPTSTDPATVFGRTYRLETHDRREWVVDSACARYAVERGDHQGALELVRRHADELQFAGWAVDRDTREPARTVAIFMSGRYLGYGAAGAARPDLVERLGTPAAQFAGFNFFVTTPSLPPDLDDVRLFVRSTDGRAAELPLAQG